MSERFGKKQTEKRGQMDGWMDRKTDDANFQWRTAGHATLFDRGFVRLFDSWFIMLKLKTEKCAFMKLQLLLWACECVAAVVEGGVGERLGVKMLLPTLLQHY